MSTGTTAAMASVASSQAAIASAQAHQALVERCKITMPNFNAQKATVTEMREYSFCVKTLYPEEMSDGMTVLLKVAFVVALAGMGAGAWSQRGSGWPDMIVVGILGFIGMPCIMGFAVGVLLGIKWLIY